MTKTAKAPAAVPKTKPARVAMTVASTEPNAARYRATGRIAIDGLDVRPGDAIELTERQAFGLRGFVEPIPAEEPDAPTE